MSEISSTDGQRSPSSSAFGSTRNKSRVVTSPPWARNFSPDEFPDDDEPPSTGHSSRSLSPERRPDRLRASLSSAFQQPPTSAASTSGATLLSPPPALAEASHHRRASRLHGAEGDRWWTFTLPTKYLDRVHDYVNAGLHGEGEAGEKGKEKEGDEGDDRRSVRAGRKSKDKDEEKGEYHRSLGMSMGTHLVPPTVFSINQTQTPGWSAPWTPFHREKPHDPTAFHFSSDVPTTTKASRFEAFVLENVFAPLVFRFFNLALNVCTLAIASNVRRQEVKADVRGIIGSSTLMMIVVSPFAILHIFVNLYVEYTGRPIGIWAIRKKMFHTLTELIFICLWSSILSLAFDDLFTSPLQCTAWTPYARYNTPPASVGSADVEGSLADSICGQQIALVTLVFLSVGMYIAVLVVSLFRIFAKVSRK